MKAINGINTINKSSKKQQPPFSFTNASFFLSRKESPFFTAGNQVKSNTFFGSNIIQTKLKYGIYANSNQNNSVERDNQKQPRAKLSQDIQKNGRIAKRIQCLPRGCRSSRRRVTQRPFIRYLRRLEQRRVITTEERFGYEDEAASYGRRQRYRILRRLERRARGLGSTGRGDIVSNFRVTPKTIRVNAGEAARISFILRRRARSISWGILEWEGSSEYGRGVGRGGYRFFRTSNNDPGFKYAYWNGTWSRSRSSPPETGTYRVFLWVRTDDGRRVSVYEHIRVENPDSEVVHPRHASGYNLERLTFDGSRVVLRDSNGNTIEARAISGLRPRHRRNPDGRNYTLRRHQWARDRGPIPNGRYTIHRRTVQHPQLRRGALRYSTGGTASAWGIGRIPLRPYSRVSPDGSVTRTGFYLHLDTRDDGTAGCIGIHPGDIGKFNNMLSLMGRMENDLLVEVNLAR